MTLASQFAAAIAFAALLATPPAFAAPQNTVEGRWFTEGVENGTHIQVFLDNKADGTYVKDVRVIENCEPSERARETGTWTFERGNYATASETLDGRPVTGSQADTHDLFAVNRVDDSHINLFDSETRIAWALVLVPPVSAFPPPRGCAI